MTNQKIVNGLMMFIGMRIIYGWLSRVVLLIPTVAGVGFRWLLILI
jgi:hypothetical protein